MGMTVDYSGQDLRGRNFANADLTGANMRGVNLERATLAGANLTGTDLRRANLYGVVGLPDGYRPGPPVRA